MPDQSSVHPRDRKHIAPGKRVVARLEVRLASGETNGIWQITRSVIYINRLRMRSVLNLNMREQSLPTAVRDNGRAFEQILDKATPHTPTNAQNKIDR